MHREQFIALPDDTEVLNLGGLPISLGVICLVINLLEKGKSVALTNAYHYQHALPQALTLGMQLQKALSAAEAVHVS
jgi:hypothetical protein